MEQKTYGKVLFEIILGSGKDGNGKINIDFGILIAKRIPEIKMPKEDQINFGIALFHVLKETISETYYHEEHEILAKAMENLACRKDKEGKNNAEILLRKIGDITESLSEPQGMKALDFFLKEIDKE